MTEFGNAYGLALYELAVEENMEELIRDQLLGVVAILKENPKYMRLADSSTIPKAERLDLLEQAFGKQTERYLVSFMKMLCERGALGALPECSEAFLKAYNDRHGIVPATVVSAKPLSQEKLSALKDSLEKKTGKHVQLTAKVDPTLVGGLRVEMKGMRFDNTIAVRMDNLRRALLTQS